jgi:hypothetical protein
MLMLILATTSAGLFCGAAVYINLVEHPARMSCGTEFAVRESCPSYRRATMMQASLALVGLGLGLAAAWDLGDWWVTAGALLLGAVVPFTLLVILPTNHRLMDSSLDPRGPEAARLLARWNRLHAVRSALSAGAFVVLLCRVASHGVP